MRTSIKKPYIYILLVLFVFAVPLFQSLLFSSNSNGAIVINKEVSIDFIQSDKKNILLYFGYVGCADVCTPFLQKLSDLYESDEFKVLKDDTDIFFLNLTPSIEPEQADQFAKYFHKSFKGIYLSRREVLSLDRSFELFFSDDLQESTELNHTDYLYLIRNNSEAKVLQSIYFTHPLSEKKLINDMINKNKSGQ